MTETVVSGAFSADLIGSSDGIVYDVTFIETIGGKKRRIPLGPIVLDTAGTFALADLLPIPIPPNATDRIIIKRGDTINIGAIWLDEFNRPVSLDMTTVTADLKAPDGTTTAFTVTIDSDVTTGRYGLSLTAAQTDALDPGSYTVDIKYLRNGQVAHSSTGTITIIERITA